MALLDLLTKYDVAALNKVSGSGAVKRLAREMLRKPGPDDYSLSCFVETNSLFVHIPKAAGVSVTRALYGCLAGSHYSVAEYKQIFRPSTFEKLFKFSFVRNPYERIFSAFTFLKRGGMNDQDAAYGAQVLGIYPDFERFVMDGLLNDEIRLGGHFNPQSHFLFDAAGTLNDLNFIGRFETLERDFGVVAERVKKGAALAHENETGRAKADAYRAAYTPQMIDQVTRLYGAAITSLGYDFDGPAREWVRPLDERVANGMGL